MHLCTIPADEVRETCERLEAAGVPCKVARTTPESDAKFSILVPDEHVHAAEEALVISPSAEENAVYTPQEDFERKLDNWICPRCDARELKAMRLQGNWKLVQLAWLLFLVVPIVVSFAAEGRNGAGSLSVVQEPPSWLVLSWALTVAAVGGVLLAANRVKKCKKCGWRSDSTEAL